MNAYGPRRALDVGEQLEVKREMRIAHMELRTTRTARDLARRYGVSSRTIYRYVDAMPVPRGMETLRMHLDDWADEREIDLSYDDMVTLLAIIHRAVG